MHAFIVFITLHIQTNLTHIRVFEFREEFCASLVSLVTIGPLVKKVLFFWSFLDFVIEFAENIFIYFLTFLVRKWCLVIYWFYFLVSFITFFFFIGILKVEQTLFLLCFFQ